MSLSTTTATTLPRTTTTTPPRPKCLFPYDYVDSTTATISASSSKLSYTYQWQTYCEQLLEEETLCHNRRIIIYGLAFASSDDEQYLVACTDMGELCIWELPTPTPTSPPPSTPPANANASSSSLLPTNNNKNRTNLAIIRCKVSDYALYDCQIVPRQEQQKQGGGSGNWLIVSGDDGVLLFDWERDVLPKLQKRNKKRKKDASSSSSSSLIHIKYRQRYRPYPNAICDHVEINRTVLLNGSLYGAANDDFGGYKWDLETGQIVTTYRSNNSNTGGMDMIHAVPNSHLLLSGGQDSLLRIWDTKQDQLIETINCYHNNNTAGTATTAEKNASSSKRGRNSSRNSSGGGGGGGAWISSCTTRDEHWWTVGGGCGNGGSGNTRRDNDEGSRSGGGGAGGYLTTLHGPTRSVVSTVSTREIPQQLLTTTTSSTMISAANVPCISLWKNPMDFEAERPHSVWGNAVSVYALANNSQQTAFGGVGNIVDILDVNMQHEMQLCID